LRLNFPTPWTRRVLPHFRNTVRLGCRVVATVGRGQGGALVSVRARPAAGSAAEFARWLREVAPAALLDRTGVVGVHLLETVPETTRVKTAEGKLKGGEVGAAEEPWPWVLLVETGAVDFAQALAAEDLAPARLAERGGDAGALTLA